MGGEYTVVAKDENSLVKRLYLAKGKSISYQTHSLRDEVWVITSGSGELILDGETLDVKVGDTLRINRSQKHMITALSDLHIVEVQLGDAFDENDIERFQIE